MNNQETLAIFGTQDTRPRQTNQKTIKKTKKMNQGKQFLPLIRHPPCYSYIQELDITIRKQTPKKHK